MLNLANTQKRRVRALDSRDSRWIGWMVPRQSYVTMTASNRKLPSGDQRSQTDSNQTSTRSQLYPVVNMAASRMMEQHIQKAMEAVKKLDNGKHNSHHEFHGTNICTSVHLDIALPYPLLQTYPIWNYVGPIFKYPGINFSIIY